jgi:hypothetical protein
MIINQVRFEINANGGRRGRRGRMGQDWGKMDGAVYVKQEGSSPCVAATSDSIGHRIRPAGRSRIASFDSARALGPANLAVAWLVHS